ncbi:MAG TPA: sulfurtransferase [Paracoccus solventivorans]|uniref:Sulfurtransferase n=1 Tax=Paracoccus solventivorans TaxID=53463 RepID=A0A832PKB1_9RHOB|nr:rhodanese-like domain-containing protein [Paracoccus solventivorans]HHW32878.1 sulfurtransferase [Paracoccus solventivorans]
MTRIVFATLAAVALGGMAAAASAGPLLTPSALAAQTEEQPIILDIRDTGYEDGHVPGAIWTPYATFRGPSDNPGAVPDVAKLEAAFEQFGLEPDQPIVIVPEGRSDTDFGAAARVYWTLKSTGFTDLAILNGGTQAWSAAGFPVETKTNNLLASDLELSFSDRWLASAETVAATVSGSHEAVLVDARPEDFFTGRSKHDLAVKPGTLPGARNLPHGRFFQAGSPVIAPELDAGPLRQALGLDAAPGREVVAFCNTGHWAATEWFALSELAGIEDVKLYPGSMVEWSQAKQPMENTPTLLSNLTRQIFGD